MATIIVSAEGTSVRRNAGGKPKLLVRGRRRHAVVKSMKQLQVLQNQDDAENRRSSVNNYNPYLVLGAPSSKVRKALETLLEALDRAIKEKV